MRDMFQNKHVIGSMTDLFGFLRANLPFILIIVFLVSATYANSLNNKFISADDEPAIVYNQELRDFNKALSSGLLQNILFSLFINTTGLNTLPFHLLSITLHIFNSILVFTVIYMIFGKKVSIIASLLFSVHPVNSEAVLWISAIPYLFNGFFALLTLLFFVLFSQTSNKTFWYISGLIFFAGTILAKNAWILSIVPLVIIVGEFMLEKGEGFALKNGKRLFIYWPYLLSAGFFIFIYIASEFSLRLQRLETLYGIDPTTTTPLLNRIPYTIYMMLYLLITPFRLTIYHEGKLITSALYMLMILISLAYLALTAFALKKNYKIMAGILLVMPISIFPSFSPVLIAWFIAERYLYLASVFFCVALTFGILFMEKKLKIKNLALYLTTIILTLYSIRSLFRTNDFKSNVSIWSATQKAAPLSYRTYNNLGDALSREKNYNAAIESFEIALKINPNYADAKHNLANTYFQMGELDKAEELFTEANKTNPKLYQSLFMLGIINYKKTDLIKAKEYFEKASQISPNNAQIMQAIKGVDSALKNSK
jgi:tetratricopeptide (TPR) repeat protein